MDKKVHFSGVDKKVQIVLAGTVFTGSYIQGVCFGVMDFFVCISETYLVVKTHSTYAT